MVKYIKPLQQHIAIIAVRGRGVLLLKMLTIADANAPRPICNVPIKADALPACLANGVNDSAEALGEINPWQHKKRKIKLIIPACVTQPFQVAVTMVNPTRL